MVKQVVHRHLGLNIAAVRVLAYSVSGYHGEMQGLAGARQVPESGQPTAKQDLIILVDNIGVVGKLHLANIDNLVAAVDKQVDLRTFPLVAVIVGEGWARPRTHIAQHRLDANGFLDLRDVLQANLLEGIAAPRHPRRVLAHIAPKMMVLAVVVRHETQVEQTEQVSQLIHRIAFGFSECRIFSI